VFTAVKTRSNSQSLVRVRPASRSPCPPSMVLPMPKPRMVGPGTLAKIIPHFRTVRKMCRSLITLCVLSLPLILIDNDKNCYTLYLNISGMYIERDGLMRNISKIFLALSPTGFKIFYGVAYRL